MNVHRVAMLIFFCAFVSMSTACASIVKKPEIFAVKKVAVLSVYANNDVPKHKGNKGAGGEAWGPDTRLEVAGLAAQNVEATLASLGFQVLSGQSVIESEDYQKAFMPAPDKPDSGLNKFAANVMALREVGYFTPQGMHPIELASEQGKTSRCMGNGCNDPKKKLGALARQLGVDAVAVVKFDYCYQGASKMGNAFGAGRALITAATSIRLVSKEGDMIIDMPDPVQCEGNTRASSSEALPMVGGRLMIFPKNREKVVSMFDEATQGSLEQAVALINQAKQK